LKRISKTVILAFEYAAVIVIYISTATLVSDEGQGYPAIVGIGSDGRGSISTENRP
jgi:hypothetical protein